MKRHQALAALAVAACAALLRHRGSAHPPVLAHMLGNTVAFQPDILSADAAASLRRLMKDFGTFPTNVNDLRFYNTSREHIGEARPIGPDGKCDHPFLVPSQDRSLCVLAGRIDIGRHFIMTGGMQGLREPYSALISRVQSFGRYMFNLTDHPDIAALFEDPAFVALARRVCPAHKTHLDPFQFNLIVQLPGQTVAAHVDGVYFWGATRFQFPQVRPPHAARPFRLARRRVSRPAHVFLAVRRRVSRPAHMFPAPRSVAARRYGLLRPLHLRIR